MMKNLVFKKKNDEEQLVTPKYAFGQARQAATITFFSKTNIEKNPSSPSNPTHHQFTIAE